MTKSNFGASHALFIKLLFCSFNVKLCARYVYGDVRPMQHNFTASVAHGVTFKLTQDTVSLPMHFEVLGNKRYLYFVVLS